MSESEEGLTIAVSPVQLAAILAGESIGADANFTNRVWGTFKTLGGVLELVGAGVLCLAPEPTGVTKVGCVFMGVHGSDGVSAGLLEMATGRTTPTLTEQGANKAAQALGASPSTANTVALTIDVGVPALFTAMIGALRVGAIRSGRFSLLAHEAAPGSKLGGHTIARHVGQSDAQMRERLTRMVQEAAAKGRRGPLAVSSFRDLSSAEKAVAEVLRSKQSAITTWATAASKGGTPRLEIPAYDCKKVIGEGVVRMTGNLEKMRKVTVVLVYRTYNGMPYFVLTAHPVP